MKVVADTHTHTLACTHAYSTLLENVQEAKRKGLSFLAWTEHAPSLQGAPDALHFINLGILPRCINDIVVLKGAEVNIIDYSGGLDLPDSILKKLDWVIASLHTIVLEPSTSEDHTKAWLAIAANPLVDVIGHCGDSRYFFDYEVVIPVFAQYNKIVEINAHSFSARPGSHENCREIAKLCQKHGVRVVVSSDAHFATQVGEVEPALELLRSLDFPEELILNTDYDRFLQAARKTSGKALA